MEIRKEGSYIAVVMDHGEDLEGNLKTLAEMEKGAHLLVIASALGMLEKVKMGYWNGEKYEIHEANEPVELLGISGIITPQTDPNFHLHIIVGLRNGQVMGGHFIEARVCNTLEMFLVEFGIPVIRKEIGGLKKLRFTK
ncbi:MAG: DNA-binding protein [bacterium]|nr:DNA-binding protein [bacterium]